MLCWYITKHEVTKHREECVISFLAYQKEVKATFYGKFKSFWMEKKIQSAAVHNAFRENSRVSQHPIKMFSHLTFVKQNQSHVSAIGVCFLQNSNGALLCETQRSKYFPEGRELLRMTVFFLQNRLMVRFHLSYGVTQCSQRNDSSGWGVLLPFRNHDRPSSVGSVYLRDPGTAITPHNELFHILSTEKKKHHFCSLLTVFSHNSIKNRFNNHFI